MNNPLKIQEAYTLAKESYAALGVDTDVALETLKKIPISLHCWQGDDVGGFETPDATLTGGGILVTGGYPGKARTLDELRQDMAKAFSMIPGNNRVNLQASYGDFGDRFVDRNEITIEHFQGWIDWAKEQGLKLDLNSTLFSHPKSNDGFTLSSIDPDIRAFWIEHVNRCRKIGAHMGSELDSACIHNLWIPDGFKDIPADRRVYRENLKNSLDDIFATEYSASELKDAVESKLFGIGSEAYVVGSHEFYLGYAVSREKMVCLDTGHFHPTESIADKISSILQFTDEVHLHISRGVRWDSDHVTILDDNVRALTEEIIRNGHERVHIGTDFFDATMNRIGAWVIGARSVQKGLLMGLLQPRKILMQYEQDGNYFARLGLLEDLKTMPAGAVWDYYCQIMDVPACGKWIQEIMDYEANTTSKRG